MSNKFFVAKIIDGDTFSVSPNWEWNEQSGDRVRPIGWDTPEKGKPGFEEAKEKLSKLIFGKYVELQDAVKIDRGRIVCDVFLNGKNIAIYFPAYR